MPHIQIQGEKDRRLSLSNTPDGKAILAIRELGSYTGEPDAAICVPLAQLEKAVKELVEADVSRQANRIAEAYDAIVPPAWVQQEARRR